MDLIQKEEILQLVKYLEFEGNQDYLVSDIRNLAQLNNDSLSNYTDKEFENKLFRAALSYNLYTNTINLYKRIINKYLINNNVLTKSTDNNQKNINVFISYMNEKIYDLLLPNYYLDIKSPIIITFNNHILNKEERNNKIREIEYSNQGMTTDSFNELKELLNRENELPLELETKNKISNQLRNYFFKLYGIKDNELYEDEYQEELLSKKLIKKYPNNNGIIIQNNIIYY